MVAKIPGRFVMDASTTPLATAANDSTKAFMAWQATMARRAQDAAKNNSVPDWKNMKIDPSQLTMEMGPALTEEQFKEYCKNTGIRPQVIRKK